MERSEIKTLIDVFQHIREIDKPDLIRYRQGDGIVDVSTKQFEKDVLGAAARIAQSGCKNQNVAIIGENSYAYIVAYFAAMISRNVPVLIDKAMPMLMIEEIIDRTDCRMILYSLEYAENSDISGIASLCIEGLLNAEKLPFVVPSDITEDDIATLFLTSGTMGAFKIVPLTHKNFLGQFHAEEMTFQTEGCTVLCLPMHHVFGMITHLLYTLYIRQTILINRSIRELMADIQLQQPTTLVFVPAMFGMFMKSLGSTPSVEGFKQMFGSKLDTIIFGGAPFPYDPTLIVASGVRGVNGYGITETAASVAYYDLQIPSQNPSGIAMLPMKSVSLKISEAGEILVKGDMVFGGYYDDEEATKAAFDGEYYKTGDVGYLDENGRLHITGRLKNLIILPNGENIPAEKLEAYLYRLPYVTECIVKEADNQITAVLFSADPETAKANIKKDLAEINKALPVNQHIMKVQFRETPFAKTTSMKIKRTEC